jgi:hypothetical protein
MKDCINIVICSLSIFKEHFMKLSVRGFLVFSIFIISWCYCSNPTGPSKPVNYAKGNNYVSGDAKLRLSVPSDWYLTVDTTIGIYRLPCIG